MVSVSATMVPLLAGSRGCPKLPRHALADAKSEQVNFHATLPKGAQTSDRQQIVISKPCPVGQAAMGGAIPESV